MAYSSVEKVLDVLKLAYFDPAIVGEAAKGLGVVAKGKGKGKETHLTAKVSVPPITARYQNLISDTQFQLLWAQKLWNFALPKIIEGDSEAKGESIRDC